MFTVDKGCLINRNPLAIDSDGQMYIHLLKIFELLGSLWYQKSSL